MYECWLPEVYFLTFDVTTASKPRQAESVAKSPKDSTRTDNNQLTNLYV